MGKNLMAAGAVVALIAVLTIGVIFYQNNQNQSVATTDTKQPEASQDTQAMTPTSGKYKDGEYSAIGTYQTPAGQEKVGVTLTLTGNTISKIKVDELGVAPTSKKMQADFGAHYQPMVLGKNIDEVVLTKVSGSSLTPKGFNNALDQIKQQAQS